MVAGKGWLVMSRIINTLCTRMLVLADYILIKGIKCLTRHPAEEGKSMTNGAGSNMLNSRCAGEVVLSAYKQDTVRLEQPQMWMSSPNLSFD
jgi:hypothetical protein